MFYGKLGDASGQNQATHGVKLEHSPKYSFMHWAPIVYKT